MTNQSASIDFFKKQAKLLLKSFESGGRAAIDRIRSVVREDAQMSLMKVQHVVAVESGFAKWEDLVRASDIELRLVITMLKVPDLTDFGIGVYDQRKLSIDERQVKLQEERSDLRKNLASIEQTVMWLRENIAPIKTIGTRRTSYGLKHLAERSMDTYITNGAFIAAAIIAGYGYKIRPGSPNVHFGMSEKSIHEIERSGR